MNVFRKIKRNKEWFLVNLLGLTIAIACSLLIILYSQKELSYDTFHSKADDIYRVTTEVKSNDGSMYMNPARVPGNWTEDILKKYPEIEKRARIIPYRNAVITIDDNTFYTTKAFATDSNFFKVFDFNIIAGDVENSFKQPNSAFITESIAKKYFGTKDVIGKNIEILHQHESKSENYTIDGIMEDFPESSHFHIDILTSYKEIKGRTDWAYTYFLMSPKANISLLTETIQKEWDAERKAKDKIVSIDFQNVTDIHLYSHKSAEIEQNGSLNSLIVLICSGAIILFIALINFFNLSRVQFVAEIKSIKVKIINGANKKSIITEKIKENIPLLLLSLSLGFIIAYQLNKTLKVFVFQNTYWNTIIWFVIISSILILGTVIISAVFSKLTTDKQFVKGYSNSYKFPLIAQLSLSIIAISGTFILNSQMDFMTSLHPSADNKNMLIIKNNPQEVAFRYDALKEKLLKLSEVKNVTSVMGVPGGDLIDNFRYKMEGITNKENQSMKILTADTNFFQTMGIKAISGTEILTCPSYHNWEQKAIDLSFMKKKEKRDEEAIKKLENEVGGYSDTYILNESAVKSLGFASNDEVIGKQFEILFNIQNLFPKGKIIGVVPDFHYANLFNKEEPLVIVTKKLFSRCFIITLNNTNNALDNIAKVWEEINPGYPFVYEFINDRYKTVYEGEYAQTKIVSIFAIISILLSAMGVFSLSSFTIQRRTKEIGIRKVNGATVTEVLTLLNRDFVKWVIVAFVIATPIAYYAMNKWLESFAYKTSLSWWIFALAGLSALVIALLTVSWQSWRTARRNPVEALRYE